MTAVQSQLVLLIRELWQKYKSDEGYSTLGKLNLVAMIGEKGGEILQLIEAQEYKITELQKQLEEVRATQLELRLPEPVEQPSADQQRLPE